MGQNEHTNQGPTELFSTRYQVQVLRRIQTLFGTVVELSIFFSFRVI